MTELFQIQSKLAKFPLIDSQSSAISYVALLRLVFLHPSYVDIRKTDFQVRSFLTTTLSLLCNSTQVVLPHR